MGEFLVGYFNDDEETYDVTLVKGEESQIKELVEKYNDDSFDTEYFYQKCEGTLTVGELDEFLRKAEDEEDDDDDEEYCNLYEEESGQGSPFIEKKSKTKKLIVIIDKLRTLIIILIIIALGVGIVNWICNKF